MLTKQRVMGNSSFVTMDRSYEGCADFVGIARVYGIAWLQSMCVYYGVSLLLHFVVPALTNPHRVQKGDMQSSADTRRDAFRALVPVSIRCLSQCSRARTYTR